MKDSKKIFQKIQASEDPLRELGPGISTYHQLLIKLFILFLLLLLIHLPVMNIFFSYDFYKQSSVLNKLTLGNMGFSKTECSSASMFKGNSFNISCKAGAM